MNQDSERRVEFKLPPGRHGKHRHGQLLDLDGRTIVSIVEKGCGSWKLCCSRGGCQDRRLNDKQPPPGGPST
jgi:hypothetical protein